MSIRGSLFLLAVAILTAAGCGRQPTARGKTLGEWMDLLKRSNDVTELKETASALAELGPQAEPAAWELVRLLSDRLAFGHYRSLNESEVQEVFAALRDALRAMGRAAAPHVIAAIENNRPVSADVIDALHDSALPELARGLESPNVRIRRAVAQRWRDLGARGREGAPMLVRVLRDPDTVARQEAARSLGAIRANPDLAVPALAAVLGDPAAVVRVAAVESLSGFPSNAAAALPAIVERLEDPDAAVVAAAVEAVGRLSDRKQIAAPLLVKALTKTDAAVRRAAMRAAIAADALALLPSQVLVPFVEPSGERDPAVRAEEDGFSVKVVEALLRTDPKAALFAPGLVGRLRQTGDTSTAPRQDAFARIGAPAVPALAAMLAYGLEAAADAAPTEAAQAEVVRYEAAMGLAAIGGAATESLPALEERVRVEPSEPVRSAAIEALRRIRADARRRK